MKPMSWFWISASISIGPPVADDGHQRLTARHDLADRRHHQAAARLLDRRLERGAIVLGLRLDQLLCQPVGFPFRLGQLLRLIGDELVLGLFDLGLERLQLSLGLDELALLADELADLGLILL